MPIRRIQTGRGGPSVNSVLGRLRGTHQGPGNRQSPVNTGTEAAATLTTALTGTNNDLKYTAVQKGTAGNAIRVRYVNPGTMNAVLGVTVSGDDITVNLATDGASAITSTAALIKAAVDASPAHGKVTVANAPANDGTGVVTALAFTALTGGVDVS